MPEETYHAGAATKIFGLSTILLFVLAAAEQIGYFAPTVLDNFTPQEIAASGVLTLIAAVACYVWGY